MCGRWLEQAIEATVDFAEDDNVRFDSTRIALPAPLTLTRPVAQSRNQPSFQRDQILAGWRRSIRHGRGTKEHRPYIGARPWLGIPDDFRPHIFEKFAQADATNTRQKGGTGLGLSIVKQIVERLGGEVNSMTRPMAARSFMSISRLGRMR